MTFPKFEILSEQSRKSVRLSAQFHQRRELTKDPFNLTYTLPQDFYLFKIQDF